MKEQLGQRENKYDDGALETNHTRDYITCKWSEYFSVKKTLSHTISMLSTRNVLNVKMKQIKCKRTGEHLP